MLAHFNLILYCEESQGGMSRHVCFKGTIHHIICNFHVNLMPMMITANWCHVYPHFPVQFYACYMDGWIVIGIGYTKGSPLLMHTIVYCVLYANFINVPHSDCSDG